MYMLKQESSKTNKQTAINARLGDMQCDLGRTKSRDLLRNGGLLFLRENISYSLPDIYLEDLSENCKMANSREYFLISINFTNSCCYFYIRGQSHLRRPCIFTVAWNNGIIEIEHLLPKPPLEGKLLRVHKMYFSISKGKGSWKGGIPDVSNTHTHTHTHTPLYFSLAALSMLISLEYIWRNDFLTKKYNAFVLYFYLFFLERKCVSGGGW